MDKIHPQELLLIDKKWTEKRTKTFILGRIAAHKALSECNKRSEPVLRGNMNEPLWPDLYTGSISHKDEVAVSAVALRASYSGIGIDIEGLDIKLSDEEISLFCNNNEKDSINRLGYNPVTVFSAKESFLKAYYSYSGIIPDMKEINIINLMNEQNVNFRILTDTLFNRYVITLCLFKA